LLPVRYSKSLFLPDQCTKENFQIKGRAGEQVLGAEHTCHAAHQQQCRGQQ